MEKKRKTEKLPLKTSEQLEKAGYDIINAKQRKEEIEKELQRSTQNMETCHESEKIVSLETVMEAMASNVIKIDHMRRTISLLPVDMKLSDRLNLQLGNSITINESSIELSPTQNSDEFKGEDGHRRAKTEEMKRSHEESELMKKINEEKRKGKEQENNSCASNKKNKITQLIQRIKAKVTNRKKET